MADPWQRTDFSKKGGGNQRADPRTEKALEKLKRADRRRAAGWQPIDETKIEKGTMRRIGKVDNATGGVIKTGWRGKIDINKKKPGEPIPKGETQITKGGKNVEVNPPRRTPSRIKPKAGKPPGYYTREIEILKRDILPTPIDKRDPVQKGIDFVKKNIDARPILKAGKNFLKKAAFLVPDPEGVLEMQQGRDRLLDRLRGKEEMKKIPKQTPKELGPRKGRRNGPCPSMTRKGKTLYARDGSRCGRRAATVRGPTRGYD